MLTCDICGRPSKHFFLRRVKDKDWKWEIRDVWSCHRCIDLPFQLWEILQTRRCLNTMEVCRIINGVERVRDCVRGQKFGESRTWRGTRCNAQQLNCTFHYCDVYQALKKLERRGSIKTAKRRFWDKTPMQTDVFRFWFVTKKDYYNRVLRHTLDGYI